MENTNVNPADDIDITLAAGDFRLTVSPYGASLRGLARAGGSAIITEYRGAANKVAGQGDVLIPFPGRVTGGMYTFEGKSYQLAKNDKESPSAIHGFVRTVGWAIVSQADHEATFRTSIEPGQNEGYPFSLTIDVTYRATPTGMECETAITNTGSETAPVAAGNHPYFTVGSELIDADTLHVPFDSYLEFANLLPTGNVLPVDGAPVDFRTPRKLEKTSLNTCYLGPQRDADGKVRVRLANPESGRAVTVWMDEAYNYVVLYSGDPLPEGQRRRSLAIEPMTCGSDAFNFHEWGLIALKPGDTARGTWGVVAE